MFKASVDKDISIALIGQHHAAALFQLVDSNRDFLRNWLPWVDGTKHQSDTEDFIRFSLHQYADEKSMVCVIEYQQQVAGVVGYNTISKDLSKVELGYWLAPDFNGKGIMTRCCRYLIDYAFDELNIDKIQIAAAEDNLASRAVIERLGLSLEGTINNAENVNGRVLNHAVYGLLKS